MQKSTTVFSVPLAELDEQLRDIESWPAFLPELQWVRRTGNGRYVFGVRQGGAEIEVPVAVRRSPHGSGMIWTVTDGPAWNGHLYLQVVDGRRTRVHLELHLETPPPADPTGATAATQGLARLVGLVANDDWVLDIPA
jgi:hypothetical protein